MPRLRYLVRHLCVSFLACLPLVGQNDSATTEFQQHWKLAKPLTPEESIEKATFLSEGQRSKLVKALLTELHRPRDQQSDEQTLRSEAPQYRALPIDVANHMGDFVLVQGIGETNCSPTGNCSIWIFRPEADRYSVVLYGIGQVASTLPSSTNGHRDIVLSMHGSAFFYALKVYQFRGTSYRRSACYEENFRGQGSDGEYQDLEEPLITQCKK